jgi:hypothetical protein
MAKSLQSAANHKKLHLAEALVNEFLFNIPKNQDSKSWSNELGSWV